MKNYLIIITLLLFVACASKQEQNEIKKEWLGKKVNFERINSSIHTYHMFDTTGAKVGSMIFGSSFEDGMLISRDTSQFDNGSVYETAEFRFDTSSFKMKSVSISMDVGPSNLLVDVSKVGDKITGVYQVTRDTVVNQYDIDSLYSYDVFRSELYMLIHTLDYQAKDSLAFRALAPTSMGLSDASITYETEEEVTVPSGTFTCDVIWLKSDGVMPSNKIWITKEDPIRIVKFYVPGPELTIELVESR